MVTYSKDAVERAKKDGLHLVKVELNGRHAKKGTMSMAGPCGPETAVKVADLIALLCDAKGRMK